MRTTPPGREVGPSFRREHGRALRRVVVDAARGLLFAAAATTATAAPYLLVSGRWDNTLVVIDLAKAIDPANDGTPKAIVNRLRVTPDLAPNTPASGQPVNVVLSPDKRFAYDVLHPRMIEFLLANEPPLLEVEDGALCISDGERRWDPDDFRRHVAFVQRFCELWPRHLVKELQS